MTFNGSLRVNRASQGSDYDGDDGDDAAITTRLDGCAMSYD